MLLDRLVALMCHSMGLIVKGKPKGQQERVGIREDVDHAEALHHFISR